MRASFSVSWGDPKIISTNLWPNYLFVPQFFYWKGRVGWAIIQNSFTKNFFGIFSRPAVIFFFCWRGGGKKTKPWFRPIFLPIQAFWNNFDFFHFYRIIFCPPIQKSNKFQAIWNNFFFFICDQISNFINCFRGGEGSKNYEQFWFLDQPSFGEGGDKFWVPFFM